MIVKMSSSQVMTQDNLVTFRDLMKDFQAKRKESAVARKTEKGLRSYRNSGEVKYPRLYGYRQTPNGMEVVEEEAKIVRIVVGLLALGDTVDEVKTDVDKRGIRNRSGNLLTKAEIIEMPKPVYAGMIKAPSGRWVGSKHYKPIVSVEVLKKAQRVVRKVSEGLKFAPPVVAEGVFLTLASSR